MDEGKLKELAEYVEKIQIAKEEGDTEKAKFYIIKTKEIYAQIKKEEKN